MLLALFFLFGLRCLLEVSFPSTLISLIPNNGLALISRSNFSGKALTSPVRVGMPRSPPLLMTRHPVGPRVFNRLVLSAGCPLKAWAMVSPLIVFKSKYSVWFLEDTQLGRKGQGVFMGKREGRWNRKEVKKWGDSPVLAKEEPPDLGVTVGFQKRFSSQMKSEGIPSTPVCQAGVPTWRGRSPQSDNVTAPLLRVGETVNKYIVYIKQYTT